MNDFERLGVFYLGREFDLETGQPGKDFLLYDSRDLTTHAVIVGMTGSGKTGLGLALLEEAAVDGVPVLAIDPKGDLGNLLLGFPRLTPEDFLPWMDPAEAQRQGISTADLARATAERWSKGLAEWGQDGSRIARLQQAADLTIYTPGSQAGVPLSLLGSLAAPTPALRADGEALGEKVTGAVGGLLALLGKEAEALRGREGVLLANILQQAWNNGENLDLGILVRRIQQPPLRTIGVIDLDTFYPPAERLELALAFNNLLALPDTALWFSGEPLSIPSLLWTPAGKPRVAIVSIAHLSDAERMFVVTALLNELVGWMRAQPGTSSLRALVLMDEIFGFFPPTANPPSKRPMLTLMKQARAFGVGVVLSTQNPVDLDYKGLANAGTWFIGRLQTDRDKQRLLDGLEGATTAGGTAFDRQGIEAILSGLGKRIFLLHSVHDPAPVVFQTRWTLSYLAGPLTRVQIEHLMKGRGPGIPPSVSTTFPPPSPGVATGGPPVLPGEIPQRFVVQGAGGEGTTLIPNLLGTARIFFPGKGDRRDHQHTMTLWAPFSDPLPVPVWQDARPLAVTPLDTAPPKKGVAFAPLPAAAAQVKNYARWGKELVDHLYQNAPLVLWECEELKEVSQPGESEGEFRGRLALRLREKRDAEVAALRGRYTDQVAKLQQRLAAAEEKLAREQAQSTQQKLTTAVSIGATVLGALFGRKVISTGTLGRAAGAVRGAGRAAQEARDVARAEDTVEGLRGQLDRLQAEIEEQVHAFDQTRDPASLVLVEKKVRPKKTDIAVQEVALVWMPQG